jgi:toxin HigB-1
MAIKSFKCRDTKTLYHLARVLRFASIEQVALRKLTQLDIAERIDDLRAPPGNRLESLSGDRAGQWSIRINERYRICFVWRDRNAEEVEIVDYH